MPASNRTNVELKFGKSFRSISTQMASNRTNVELKSEQTENQRVRV